MKTASRLSPVAPPVATSPDQFHTLFVLKPFPVLFRLDTVTDECEVIATYGGRQIHLAAKNRDELFVKVMGCCSDKKFPGFEYWHAVPVNNAIREPIP